jgi:hypothetical protein
LKADALLADQHPQALMADVVDHPLSHQELAQLRQAPGGKRQVMLHRPGLGDLLISRRWLKVNFGGRPPLYLGYSELNPSALKLRITARSRSSLVNATFPITATSMPCADNGTICARRQVTTDPLPRRAIRTSRLPSSSSISRTRRRSLTRPVSTNNTTSGSYPAKVPQGKRGLLRH